MIVSQYVRKERFLNRVVFAQIQGLYSFAVRPLSKLNTRAFPAGNCASKCRFTLIYVRKGEQTAHIDQSYCRLEVANAAQVIYV